MELREPGRDDASTIAALLNEHSRRLFGEDSLTPSTVREWFDLHGVQMWIAEHGGVAAGYVDASDESGLWNVDLRVLDPEAARQLLEAAVGHAGSGAVVRSHLASTDELAVAAHAAAGFKVVRTSFQMRIELSEPPAPAVFPEGIEVQPLGEGEEERVHAAHMDSFADHWGYRYQPYDEWRRWHRDTEHFDPSLWFLALDGDELAGLVLTGSHTSLEPGFGWVEVLGVRPPWRRRGLGGALLRHSFRELHGRGYRRVGLGVDAENTTGAVQLYERAGMRQVRRNETWELQT